MLFIVSAAILLLFAAFINALLGRQGVVALILRLFLLAWAHILLAAQITSLFRLINVPAFLLVQMGLTLAAGACWYLGGKPRLFKPFVLPRFDFKLSIGQAALTVLAVLVCLAYLAAAIEIIALPQNNYDSLTYHLARVGYWLQHQTLAVWDTPNFRQTAFPPNAEIGILWTVLFTGSERLSGFVQWGSALACAAGVIGLARLLGATRTQSLFAALIWASFPQNILQASTTQNDLVITAFLLTAVYFIRLGLQTRRRTDAAFAGIALGMAFGTKTTFLLFLPGLAAAGLIWFFARPRHRWKDAPIWAAACLAGALLFGSTIYVQNSIAYRNPIGPADEVGLGASAAVGSRLTTAFYNGLLYTYQMIDGSGLPTEAAGRLVEIKARVFGKIFRELGVTRDFAKYSIQQILYLPTRVHEDISWFGPLGFLALLPAVAIAAWMGLKKRDPNRLGLLILGAGFLITTCLLLDWTPYKSRYFVLAVGVTAPLMAFLYHPRRPAINLTAALIAAFVLGFTFLNNEARPLVGPNAVWGKDRASLRTANVPSIAAILREVERQVPGPARIATVLGANGLDALFFGEHFQHTLVQVDGKVKPNDLSAIKESGAEYLLVGPRQQFFLLPPPGLELIAAQSQTSLYRVNPAALGTLPQGAPTFPAVDTQKLIFTDPALIHTLGVVEVWTGAWAIEQAQGSGFYWFGEGEVEGLGMSIWAEQDMRVTLRLEVEPGPSRADPARSLVVVTAGTDGRQQASTLTFDSPSVLQLPVELREGMNTIGMYVMESANVTPQPGGDQRNLLVLLRKMEFAPE